MKSILITGTSKGIGKALALHYLSKEYRVAGLSRTDAHIDEPQYKHITADISQESEVVKAVKEVKKEWGRIDILINNAAVANMNPLVTTPFEAFNHINSVNYGGTFLTMREVAKVMIRQGSGRIINFTTISQPLNLETQSVYASTKAAVESLTRIAARELAPFGITVNAIGPTPVETGLIKGIPPDWLNNVIQMQAIKRMGTMEDVIYAVDFFTDDQASFITGQVMYLGGVS